MSEQNKTLFIAVKKIVNAVGYLRLIHFISGLTCLAVVFATMFILPFAPLVVTLYTGLIGTFVLIWGMRLHRLNKQKGQWALESIYVRHGLPLHEGHRQQELPSLLWRNSLLHRALLLVRTNPTYSEVLTTQQRTSKRLLMLSFVSVCALVLLVGLSYRLSPELKWDRLVHFKQPFFVLFGVLFVAELTGILASGLYRRLIAVLNHLVNTTRLQRQLQEKEATSSYTHHVLFRAQPWFTRTASERLDNVSRAPIAPRSRLRRQTVLSV